MPPAQRPANEADRLAALRSYEILDTESEQAFDDLVALAARLTHSPIALVSLIDDERQWFKARFGIRESELPRDQAFCAHAINDPDRPLVVEDATRDGRFLDNPLVTGGRGFRAYLGVPLVSPERQALGALCIVDRVPRHFDPGTVDTMRTLARAVVANLELRRALLAVRKAALTDPLTGLLNRRAAMAVLADALERGTPGAVIAIDLDHFKETNDGEGHGAGDVLLQAVADRLRSAARPNDMVGRIGGDEFAVFLAGATDRGMVEATARRILAALSKPVAFGARSLRLGATLGVAITPDDATEPEMAVRLADEALLSAKRTGRGEIGFARPEDRFRLQRLAILIRAVDDADMVGKDAVQGASVLLQPIFALGGYPDEEPELLSVEALARWTHPTTGSVPPDELFALIDPARAARLGYLVRAQALAATKSLAAKGLAGARLALNLSAAEACRADVALRIRQQVEQAGLSLDCIDVEITEEILLDRVSDQTLEQLAGLREQGARLMLDDFGTGNSGLAQLMRLPLDGLKLDKQFVQQLGIDRRAGEIVRATISLAHSLRLIVIAEGVESEDQAMALRLLGCDAVQGYLFSRPLSPGALHDWLRDRRARSLQVADLRPPVRAAVT